KALGARVIGTVSSEAKAELARAHGCDETINYSHENFAERAKALTGGVGVDVVYDGIGKDTFLGSLDSLRPLGMMVCVGNASGAIPPFDPLILAQKGSLFLTRPTIGTYTAKRTDLEALGGELFAAVLAGKVKIEVNQRYALKDAAQAHIDLESRKTTGSTILLP
ncbi:MAG TPA: zinc-binding dehydrogenase, partial [Rhodocyclaceae bacterium]|nr:zinc-binding dehydrogenase [Rhodocyclaceae bacterium]